MGRTLKIFQGTANTWTCEIDHLANEEKTLVKLSQGSVSAQRGAGQYELGGSVIFKIDFWVIGNTAEVWLNDRQFLVLLGVSGSGGNFSVGTDQANSDFDNVIIWTRSPSMVAGNIDTTGSTQEQVFAADKQLQALSFYSDLVRFEWRVNPKPGLGNDVIDIGSAVGDDVSDLIQFKEGVNLQGLTLSPSSQALLTQVNFRGQGGDYNQTLASVYDFKAIDRYGVVEGDTSNARVGDSSLARQVAENTLVSQKDGTSSLSAEVFETNRTLRQWRVGDTVFIDSIMPGLSQKARVIQIDYNSGSLSKFVTFDKFPFSRSGMIGRLSDDMGLVNRGVGGNTGNVTIVFKAGNRFINDVSNEIVYLGKDWQNASSIPKGVSAVGPFSDTLHFVNFDNQSAVLNFEGSGISVFCRKGPNLVGIGAGEGMGITIDGVLQAGSPFSLFNENDNLDQQLIFSTSSLSSSAHTISLERLGGAGEFVFIDIDVFKVLGYFWQFVIEGSAVNTSFLSWEVSDPGSRVEIKINDEDVTARLGGPFIGNQTNLDVLEFISTPGLHSIEFINTTSTEIFLEASLNYKVFVQ